MLSIAAHDAAALQFDDLASALEAGLPVSALGGDPAAGERVLHDILRRRGVRLTGLEDEVLLHTWRAGTSAAALRIRAHERRQRAEFARTLWAGLRYPVLLLALVLLMSGLLAPVIGFSMLIGTGTLVALLLGGGLWLQRAQQRGEAWLGRLPGLGRMLNELAEIPYLETLHALYGAGVQLLAAHHTAVATVRLSTVRDRLQLADGILHGGTSLREALAQTASLHPETRNLLATGEQAGQLEDALRRALLRRREVGARDLANLARRAGQALYAIAALAVILFLVHFYSGYAASLAKFRR